jgi:hypothetical protein
MTVLPSKTEKNGINGLLTMKDRFCDVKRSLTGISLVVLENK